MWVAGMAAGGAVIVGLRIVGRGYTWLVAAVVAMFAGLTALLGGGAPAWAATAAGVAGVVLAKWPLVSAVVLEAGAIAALVGAPAGWSVVSVVAGALLLGGVTSEMLLGHWFLVDPTLPRWSLKMLAAVGAVGLLADAGYVWAVGGFGAEDVDAIFVTAYVLVAVMTALLVVGVWFSLREPRYSGVMAATGLSYLAVLTAFGVVVIGRIFASAAAGNVPI